MGPTGAPRARPEPGDFVSLIERMGWLGLVRCGVVVASLPFGLLAPENAGAPKPELILASAAYLLLLFAPLAIARQPRQSAQRIVAGTLLVDGVYLACVTYATGGTQSPLRFLIVVHVVTVTLLASYRTGLKVTAWHSLLFLAALFAQAADLVPIREGLPSALPRTVGDVPAVAVLQLAGLWAVVIVTAACSAVNERELRGQKVDLDELSAVVRALDAERGASEISRILLEALCRVFGFTRGVVLASPEGDLVALAHHETGDEPPQPLPGLDDVLERAWKDRGTQLVRALDPERDRRLAALLPQARNVLVVPLLVEDGYRLGAIAVEWPGRRAQIKRWVVAIVDQFASHGALALHNAWLREQLEQKLDENRALQERLLGHNLELELKVEERTRDLSRSLHDLGVANEQRGRLLERLVHAEEETRRRIAGDIHDDPIQKVVAACMQLQLLRKTMAGSEHAEDIDKLIAWTRSSITSLRHLIFELRPHALDEEGLGPALHEYAESLDGGFDFRIDDHLEHEPASELRVVLYRMAQEALANVRKHAQADHVEIVLSEREDGFLVTITDDGVGFGTDGTLRSEPGHLGLSSMRERAEMAGGWCRLHSLPNEGTTVELWVPGEASHDRRRDEDDDDGSVSLLSDSASAIA